MDAARVMGKPFGGIWTERDLAHEMRLMVMHSNFIVCWRDLFQRCRDEQCIRMPSRAGVITGNLSSSCPMPSNVVVCWRGLLKGIICGQAFERDRVLA
jgi:hypothetical protein